MLRFVRIYYTIIGALVISFVFGQSVENDSLTTKADLSLTGFYQGGNVETKIFRAKTNFSQRLLEDWQYRNQNSYIFQEFGLQKADEDFLSLNFLDINTEKTIYPFILGFISTNYRREINLRTLTGAGASMRLLNKEKYKLKFSVSSEYEFTRFDKSDFNRNNYDGSTEIATVRGTLWLKGQYSLLDDKMIVTHECYYQPSLLAADNFRWQADVGLAFPVWKFVDFKVDYRQTYESIVVENQLEGDRFLTFGVTIKNYK